MDLETRKDFGDLLRANRLKAERTQEEYAAYLSRFNISEVQYKRAERGDPRVSDLYLMRICLALKLQPEKIFPGERSLRAFVEIADSDDGSERYQPAKRRVFYLRPEDYDNAENFHTRNLFRFLIYLPLMKPRSVADSLLRITGVIQDFEFYIMDQIEYLISEIPDSDARKHAAFIEEGIMHIPYEDMIKEEEWQLNYSKRCDEPEQLHNYNQYVKQLRENYRIIHEIPAFAIYEPRDTQNRRKATKVEEELPPSACDEQAVND